MHCIFCRIPKTLLTMIKIEQNSSHQFFIRISSETTSSCCSNAFQTPQSYHLTLNNIYSFFLVIYAICIHLFSSSLSTIQRIFQTKIFSILKSRLCSKKKSSLFTCCTSMKSKAQGNNSTIRLIKNYTIQTNSITWKPNKTFIWFNITVLEWKWPEGSLFLFSYIVTYSNFFFSTHKKYVCVNVHKYIYCMCDMH